MKVKFLQNYRVQAVDGESYEEGETYELSKDSAEYFIRRRLAEKVTGRSGGKSGGKKADGKKEDDSKDADSDDDSKKPTDSKDNPDSLKL